MKPLFTLQHRPRQLRACVWLNSGRLASDLQRWPPFGLWTRCWELQPNFSELGDEHGTVAHGLSFSVILGEA
jgi:hypothetical protein